MTASMYGIVRRSASGSDQCVARGVRAQTQQLRAIVIGNLPVGGTVRHEIAKSSQRAGCDAFAIGCSSAFAVAAVAVASPNEAAAVSLEKTAREVGIASDGIQPRTSRQISIHVRVIAEQSIRQPSPFD